MKRIQAFTQLDAMDCGPASLKIIANYYGKYFSMKFLRDQCNISREGVSLLDVGKAAEDIGLRTLAVKVSYEDLASKISLPCIIHWNRSHFIVVYKITKKRVWVVDPQLGKVKYRREEFCDQWKGPKALGYVLVLEPSLKFYENESSSQKLHLGRYFNYLKPYKGFLIQVFFAMIVGIFLSLLFPFITQAVVDIGIGTKDYDFIYILLVASVVLTISTSIFDFVQGRIMLFVSDRVNITMVSDFINKILHLPVSFFERKIVSDILARISDHGRIQSFIFSTLLSISIGVLSLIVYSIILINYSFSLFLIFVIGSIMYVLWIMIFLKRRKRLDYEMFGAGVENQNEVIQIIDGIADIKANNIQQNKKWDWEHSRMKIYDLNIKTLNLNQVQSIGAVFIEKLKNILITFFTADAVIKGEMTLGMMMSVQYIIGQMNGPVGQLIGYIQGFQDAKISLERVNEVTEEEKDEVRCKGFPMILPDETSIKIEKLSFAYHKNQENVLNNVSLEIPQGKMTAIVGASGSGKSTLMKLLLRFYDNYEGKISIGEYTDLNSIDINTWRTNCSSILQNGRIFSDTIVRNIVLYDENVDIKRLNQAIDYSNMREFIESLPLKLYTMLGQGGNGISAGQAQRILIARAIYRNPKFIFMDEATNSLDAKNEREITTNLIKTFKGVTTVVIAHRLSTVRTADKIVVLDRGTVAEQGTHEELMVRKGYYYELISNQLEVDNYEA